MVKRIMRTLKMTEIAAVDRPCQAGARMTIMKRDDSGEEYWKRDFSADQRDHLAGTGAALPDGSFPISSTQDLKNAIHAIGRAKDPAKAKAHIISRAKSLGATDLLPDDWTASKSHKDTDMTQDDIQKMIDAAVKAATDPLNAEIAKMGKKPPQKTADDMAEPDADDDTKKAWRPYVTKMVETAVAKAKEEAAAELAKREGDETLVHEGITLRKSVIGEDQFKVMKSLTEANEINTFAKRAAAEIPAMPGDDLVKAKALRAVSKLGKEDREAVEAMLKAGNAALKDRMTVIGKDGSGEDSAGAQLEKMVTTYATEKKVSKAAAYTEVLATKEGSDLYTKSLTEKPRVAA